MSEMFLTSLQTVALLLLMAIPGFIIAKIKMVDVTKAVSFISVLLLYVCQPFITFNSFLNTTYNSSILVNLCVVFAVTAVLMTGLALLARLAFSYDKNVDRRGQMSYASAMGNIGYMCIPFLQMLRPGDSVIILYATSAIAAFNLIAWTLGNYLITGDKKFISIKRAVLNPATLSLLVALPLFICNINFVRFDGLSGVANVCSLFANLVGPLSMTMLGMKFAESKLKEFFLDYRVYAAAGFKLVLSPVIAFCLTLLLSTFMNVEPIALNIIALSAMPTANNVMMFSSLYGKDTAFAAKLVLISTILSVITIPLALMLVEVF